MPTLLPPPPTTQLPLSLLPLLLPLFLLLVMLLLLPSSRLVENWGKEWLCWYSLGP